MVLFRSRSSKEKEGGTSNEKPLRWWREPLIHFFVLGLAVFGLHAALERNSAAIDNDPYLVEVTSADIEWMRTIFNKQMGRTPTSRDLRGQVNQLIREQILSREAAAMGMDENDIVVRRRLAQKMEFLFKDMSAISDPTEEQLRGYFAANGSRYEVPAQITFAQVYFNATGRGAEKAEQAARELIAQNIDPAKVSGLGDATLLATGCNQCDVGEIGSRFGTAFAETLESLESHSWHGPVASAYGIHAVYIFDRREHRARDFENVRDQVRNDWMFANQEENSRQVYGEIRSRYRVLVEGLPYDLDLEG